MDPTDDPFFRFLSTFSGEVIGFCPGRGGLDDAVSSMSFLALCERLDVTVASCEDCGPESLCFFGSDEGAAAACDSRLALLPSSLTRFEAVGKLARKEVSLFCRDPRSMWVAELQGVPHDRRRFCRDLVCYLDLAAFDLPRGTGEGILRLDIGDGVSGGHDAEDGIALLLSGADGRWRSPERCRTAIQQVITALSPYAAVRTTSPTLAILTAEIGRKAILHIDAGGGYAATWRARMAAAYPAIAFETDFAVESTMSGVPSEVPLARSRDFGPAYPGLSARPPIDLKRDLRRAVQEREALASKLASLRVEFDARVAEEVIAIERDSQGIRLLPARIVEERLGAMEERMTEAEARAAAAVDETSAERDRARIAVQSLAEVQLRREEEARQTIDLHEREREAVRLLEEVRSRERDLIDEAARWAEKVRERDACDRARCEAMDLADPAEERQVPSLQDTIAEMTRAGQLSETRMAHTLMLLKRSDAAKAEADRAASATRDRLDAVLSSTSWKVTRPLRAGVRILRRLASYGRRRSGR